MAKKAASAPKSSKNVDKVEGKPAADAASLTILVQQWADSLLKKNQRAHVGPVGANNFRVNVLETTITGLFPATKISDSYYVTVEDGKVVDLTLKGKT